MPRTAPPFRTDPLPDAEEGSDADHDQQPPVALDEVRDSEHEAGEAGAVVSTVDKDGNKNNFECDVVLISVGRKPNSQGID